LIGPDYEAKIVRPAGREQERSEDLEAHDVKWIVETAQGISRAAILVCRDLSIA
jgi:hypothetical protein